MTGRWTETSLKRFANVALCLNGVSKQLFPYTLTITSFIREQFKYTVWWYRVLLSARGQNCISHFTSSGTIIWNFQPGIVHLWEIKSHLTLCLSTVILWPGLYLSMYAPAYTHAGADSCF